jgi:myo-inositol-1(or 4)-monophosphatase
LQELKNIVKKSGELFKKGFFERKQITYKGAVDLLTEYDVAIEKELTAALAGSGYEIVGEESWGGGELPKNAIFIDPIDGTTNFVHQIPFCAISVGVWEDGKPKYAAVYNPILDEFFWAEKGKGAYLNDERIHVSAESELQKSLIATGFPYTKAEAGEDFEWVLKKMEKVLPYTRDMRRLGAASVDLCYTAKGVFDAFYEINLKPWDTAAGVLIVTEAGGRVSDELGGEFALTSRGVVASGANVHDNFLKLLNEAR